MSLACAWAAIDATHWPTPVTMEVLDRHVVCIYYAMMEHTLCDVEGV